MSDGNLGAFLKLKPNERWAPNGVMDYARSARRYKFGPTAHSPVFFSTENKTVLRRTHGQVHEPDESGPEPTMSGEAEVSAQDIQNDLEYTCPVTIGTEPGVTLNLDFDTGSSDLWVWSTQFRNVIPGSELYTFYDPTKSPTAQEAPGLKWKITYGIEGNESGASGIVYTDQVSIGSISIPNQAVEIATVLSDSFQDHKDDGLLGLAFPKINNVSTINNASAPQKTPVQNMVEQGLIREPLFTVKLDKQDSNGFYTFGYIDTTVTSNPILYTPVESTSGFWQFPSTTLKIGDRIVNRAAGNVAIADTGTTLILLDDAAVCAIYCSIPGARLDSDAAGYVFPASAIPSIPDISFAVGDNMFTIPGADLAFSVTKKDHSMRFGAIQSRGNNKEDILGDVFLKRVYVVFEQSDSPRIGVAQRD